MRNADIVRLAGGFVRRNGQHESFGHVLDVSHLEELQAGIAVEDWDRDSAGIALARSALRTR